jgi:hypothetical protein
MPTFGRVSRRTVKIAACAALCGAGTIVQVLTGAEPAPQPQGDVVAAVRANVRIEALTTPIDGPTGVQRLEARATLAPQEQSTRYLAAGNPASGDLCDSMAFTDKSPATPSLYDWRVSTRVVEVTAGSTTVRVGWNRSKAGVREESGTRTVTLRPGDRHVLDFVPSPSATPDGCSSVLLQVAADPDQQDVQLAYDVWLLHEGRAGRRWSHQRVPARATEEARFSLPPIAWSPGGEAADADDVAAVRLGVKGSIRATLSPGGLVDVIVSASRTLSWHGRGWAEGGRQAYRSKVGESASIQLPDPAAAAAIEVPGATWAAPAAPGVELRNGGGVVRFGTFFAGSRTSLVIVVTRVADASR